MIFAGACATAGSQPDAGAASAASAAPTAPAFVESDVIGKSAAALDQMFGAPALTRREGAGEFRRYAFARCGLIVILYPPEGGGAGTAPTSSAHVAAHVAATAKSSEDAAPSVVDCLAGGLPDEAHLGV